MQSGTFIISQLYVVTLVIQKRATVEELLNITSGRQVTRLKTGRPKSPGFITFQNKHLPWSEARLLLWRWAPSQHFVGEGPLLETLATVFLVNGLDLDP